MMPAISAILLLALSAQADPARGIDQFRRGRYVEARNELEKVVAARPRDEQARAFLGMTKAALHDCADAEAVFRGAGDAVLARMSGLAAVECQSFHSRWEEADRLLAKLAERFPADADVWYESAKVHRKAWDAAVFAMYTKTPSSFRVNQLSAEVFETQGKYNEAAAQYQKAIEKAPDTLNLHYRLGRCLLMESPAAENLEKARREFDSELKLNPDDAIAEFQVGQILAAQRKSADSLERYERALALRPDFAEALIAVGKARADSKQYDEAVRLFEKAANLQPANEAAHYHLMLAYRNLGRSADAAHQKQELERLQKPPEGEFADFLKKLGEKTPQQP